jgi:hypothetical protein
MRASVCIAILFVGCITLHARTKPLHDGLSPNGRFCVVVSESARKRITYDIISVRTGAILHRFTGSFQPVKDEPPDWSWNQTDAVVYWSADSRHVAIDEEVYRYGGTVLLAEISRSGVRSIVLPEKLILAQTHPRWDRHRVKVQNGWVSAHELSLVVAGTVITGELPDGRRAYTHRTFEASLHVQRGRATLMRSRDTTNEDRAGDTLARGRSGSHSRAN